MQIIRLWTEYGNGGDCTHFRCACGSEYWVGPKFTGTVRCDCGEILEVNIPDDEE